MQRSPTSLEDVRAQLEGHYPWLHPDLELTVDHAFANRWALAMPPEQLWQVISDTSRLNRTLRIPAAQFREKSGKREGQTRYFGTAFRWEEPPWEWIAGRLMVCRKQFSKGPVRSVLATMAVQGTNDGSELTVWYGWEPRGLLSRIVVPRLNHYLKNSYAQLMPALESWLRDGATPSELPLIRRKRTVDPEVNRRAQRATLEAISMGSAKDVADALTYHVLQGDPLQLDRIRPFALADQLDLPRDEMLLAALHGTRAGLLRMRWDVVCPHCRGPRASLERLDQLRHEMQCDACNVVFETQADRLELTFRVHESIRTIEPRVYCAADAALKPHVVAQLYASSARTVPLQLQPGEYLLREATFARQLAVHVGSDGSAQAKADTESLTLLPESELTLPPSESYWLLENLSMPHDAVRPGDVLSIAAYRALMGDDALKPSMALEMGHQTLLFTDVVGSTELYRELGDRAAFQAVRQHFSLVFDHIAAEGGAVIKTIGDAVMAAFTHPEPAARAARAIATCDLGAVEVRTSLHAGTCIAVNLDTGVDYFGSVVNEAAKLQQAAGPHEVAISEALAKTLLIEGELRDYASGQEIHQAVVWRPRASGSTPAPTPRRRVPTG